MKRFLKYFVLKTALFALLALVVLNPNLKRGFMQVSHTFTPESLIQTNFSGVHVALAEIDRLAVREPSKSEPLLIESYVFRRIKYVTDYDNWWNIEYWPTANEVWQRKMEDCDGRAILAASILRARGWSSTRLVVGLDHMWVQLNANEKAAGAPEKVLALMRPDLRHTIEVPKRMDAAHFLRLARAFFQPTAFRETTSEIFAEVPPIRRTILIFGLLLLCYHPCSSLIGMLAVLFAGTASATIFAQTSLKEAPSQWSIGLLVMGVAIVGSLLLKWSARDRRLRAPIRTARAPADATVLTLKF